MVVIAAKASRPSLDAKQTVDALAAARARTLALVAHLDEEQLQRSYSQIMSPLAWDLGHIAAYEDLWLAHRVAGMELLRGDLADAYDAFETPRAERSGIAALAPAEARAYMAEVRARTTAAILGGEIGDAVVCEMVIRHELQHSETMRQTLAIADLLPEGEPGLAPMNGSDGWLEIPPGAFAMGAERDGFAYDNERPRRRVQVPGFQIARRPVSNAAWMNFTARGGYERREWWSPDGWAWKQAEGIFPHRSVAAGNPDAPVCHISWFEADAFARAHDARLPSEAEWEKAATTPPAAAAQAGEADHGGERHGSEGSGGGARSAPRPALAAVGSVWEWTQSNFCGYPGFVAHPYREYSEVFFGDSYRVLRGGSWATDPRVASATFRNWDLPQRRQIFAGVRLARNAA